jgi:hypothetical protein
MPEDAADSALHYHLTVVVDRLGCQAAPETTR